MRKQDAFPPVFVAGPGGAEVARRPEDLAIRAMKPIHCARGPARCEACRAARDQPAKPKLLDVRPYGDYARPVVAISRGGAIEHRAFDVVRVFADAAEARAFAAAHGIDDVDLDPPG